MRVRLEDGTESGPCPDPCPSPGSSKYTLKEYRGSAGPVPWSCSAAPAEKYLAVIHKVYIGSEGRRYYHRFITLNEDFSPSRVSCFVRMTQERVEYWSGMCNSIAGDSYMITYGIKDSEAYIAEMTTAAIEGLKWYRQAPKLRTPESHATLHM